VERKRLLSVSEAEELTGRKAATWRRDILERRIPYVKLGRLVRIPLDAIEEIIRRGYRLPHTSEDKKNAVSTRGPLPGH
jgi:excisionase family DNA binding protein